MRKDAKCPRVWPSVPLKDIVLDAQPGFASGRREATGIIQVRMNNVSTDGNLNLNSFLRVPASEAMPKKYQLVPGDVLFNSTNSPKLVGKSAVFAGHEEPVVFSNHFLRIRVNQSRLDPGYLTRWLTEQWKHRVFEGLCTQWVNQASVRKEDLLSLKIPLPPLPEQRHIAAILDKADAIRRKRQQALRLTEDFLRSAFLDLFGDPVTNPKGWRGQSLDFVCEKISDGTHHSPPIQTFGVPYITAKHLKPYGLDFHAHPWFVSEKNHLEIFSRCDPRPGDVLYIKDGVTTGLAAINHYNFEFSMLSSLALLRPRPKLCTPQFLCEFLNNPSVKSRMLSHMSGAAIRRLTLAKIKKQEILLPPLNIQNQFSEIHSSLGKIKKQLNCSFEETNKLFHSLVQRAFRAEL